MYNPRRNGGGPIRGGPRKQQRSIFDVVRRQRYAYLEADPYCEMGPETSYDGDYSPQRFSPYENRRLPSFNQPDMPPNRIPSLLDIQPEIQPVPLLPPEKVERLRENLRSSGYRFNEEIQEWECVNGRKDLCETSSLIDQIDLKHFVKEEKATKKKIDEIIRVAQALRDKLEKEEELRQALDAIDQPHNNEYDNGVDRYNSRIEPSGSHVDPYESHGDPYDSRIELPYEPHSSPPHSPSSLQQPLPNQSNHPDKIPSLLEIKPAIPSLLDVYVEPPNIEDVIQENIQMTIQNNRYSDECEPERCWNCNDFGHRFTECRLPQMREFCFRCGRVGFDVYSCPCDPESYPGPSRYGGSNYY